MFSRVRKHINATTIVAVSALVFAMTGGAFAVTSGNSTPSKATVAKSKAKVVRGPAGPRGATGPAGATGPQGASGPQGAPGPQGAKGETGPAGANGANGAKGEAGPQGLQGKPGPEGPTGPEGTTGFTKTLPKGETETGVWTVFTGEVKAEMTWMLPISFSIPLKFALGNGAAHFIKVGEPGTTECPGSDDVPKAAEGQLCIYQGKTHLPSNIKENGEVETTVVAPTTKVAVVATAGAVLYVFYKGPAEGFIETGGTWAVTAP